MWEIAFVLPNLNIEEDILLTNIGIVNKNNQIIDQLSLQHPIIKRFVDNFFDQFQEKVNPTFILTNTDAPEIGKLEAIVGFRNIYAISSLIKAYENILRYNLLCNPLYSNYYDLYPITISRDNQKLLIDSPTIMGINDSDKFIGQTEPGISLYLESKADKSVFDSLMNYWLRAYSSGKKMNWQLIGLFRSLEMAYHAFAMPFKNYATVYDYGTSISLWVSAFEILVHKYNQNADLWSVVDCLESYSWDNKEIKKRRYRLKYKGRDERVTIVSKIYKDIYNARNTFLHGNRLNKGCVYPFKNSKQKALNVYAPLIYKVVLLSTLNIFRIRNNDISDYAKKRVHDDNLAESILKSKAEAFN